MSRALRIGTRGSDLALWQAHAVARELLQAFPDIEVEVCVIKTKGDAILDVPLADIGDKGLFTKELEHALLAGEVDICVHSMKDVPSLLPEGCVLAGMLARANAYDVLVLGGGVQAQSLDDVFAGARIGTGSLRRAAQIRALWPHIQPKEIRGNVDTRLAKAESDDYDGVILAAAGVQRIGHGDKITCPIPPTQMIPAAGQGAIGIEIRDDDEDVRACIAAINDSATFECVSAERQVLAALEGGCQVPFGAYARFEEEILVLDAIVLSLDGSRIARAHVQAQPGQDASAVALQAIDMLEAQGARAILDEIERD